MHKIILIALTQFIGFSVYAKTLDVACPINDDLLKAHSHIEVIQIADLLGDDPESNFYDVGLLNKTKLVDDRFEIAFSNECDNLYALSFPKRAVYKALALGEAPATVQLEYFAPDMQVEDVTASRKMTLHCHLTLR